MKCFIFITVRTASTRLPKKTLRKINKKIIIQNLIERLSKNKSIQDIVVCTTAEKSDDKLVNLLEKNRIKIYRGSTLNIISRLYNAAIKFNLSHFIVVEADDFFCDLDLIEKTCKILQTSKFEFIYWKNLPLGVTPLGIKTEAISKLIKKKSTKSVETGWGEFIIKSKIVKIGALKTENKKLERPEIRLTIDYQEDLKLARKLIKHLPNNFSLIDIIKTLDDNEDFKNINENVKKKYLKNFTSKTKK
jgi:spore coat polysaccharide biosynthesis protein SpsF